MCTLLAKPQTQKVSNRQVGRENVPHTLIRPAESEFLKWAPQSFAARRKKGEKSFEARCSSPSRSPRRCWRAGRARPPLLLPRIPPSKHRGAKKVKQRFFLSLLVEGSRGRSGSGPGDGACGSAGAVVARLPRRLPVRSAPGNVLTKMC